MSEILSSTRKKYAATVVGGALAGGLLSAMTLDHRSGEFAERATHCVREQETTVVNKLLQYCLAAEGNNIIAVPGWSVEGESFRAGSPTTQVITYTTEQRHDAEALTLNDIGARELSVSTAVGLFAAFCVGVHANEQRTRTIRI